MGVFQDLLEENRHFFLDVLFELFGLSKVENHQHSFEVIILKLSFKYGAIDFVSLLLLQCCDCFLRLIIDVNLLLLMFRQGFPRPRLLMEGDNATSDLLFVV